jgi:sulfite reductase alpha subunit-like flavoprotein
MTEDINGQPHDRSALFLYGSETGNSQDVAEDLGRLAERLHFETRVCEMDAVEIVCHLNLISRTYQGLSMCLSLCNRVYY